MMKKMFRLFLTVALAIACAGMWGCGKEDVEELSSTSLIGFSGDSLVVYVEEKYEETCEHKPAGADCSTREKGTRIVMDNFYTKENMWKSGKIDDKYIVDVYDLVDDSTIIEFNKEKSEFYKWTLEKDCEKLGSFSWSGCNTSRNVKAIRPWGEGKWRLVGGNENCAYAIVDVREKTITGYEKLDEFAEGCSDLWDHEGVKYCVNPFMDEEGVYENHNWYFDYGMALKNSKIDFVDTLWFNGDYGLDGSLVPYKLNSYISLGFALIRVDYENHIFDRNSIVKID